MRSLSWEGVSGGTMNEYRRRFDLEGAAQARRTPRFLALFLGAGTIGDDAILATVTLAWLVTAPRG